MNDPDGTRIGSENQDDSRDDIKDIGSFKWTKLLRVFLIRVPLWLVTILALVFASWMGYTVLTSEDSVSLRPAITDAKKATVTISTCDEQIDKNDLNIREEELKIADKLEEIEGVQDASVRIERDDELCTANDEDK